MMPFVRDATIIYEQDAEGELKEIEDLGIDEVSGKKIIL